MENVDVVFEELDKLLDKYAKNPTFIHYLLTVADIMDLLPLDFEDKQNLLYILILQGEIIKLEWIDKILYSRYDNSKADGICQNKQL